MVYFHRYTLLDLELLFFLLKKGDGGGGGNHNGLWESLSEQSYGKLIS